MSPKPVTFFWMAALTLIEVCTEPNTFIDSRFLKKSTKDIFHGKRKNRFELTAQQYIKQFEFYISTTNKQEKQKQQQHQNKRENKRYKV